MEFSPEIGAKNSEKSAEINGFLGSEAAGLRDFDNDLETLEDDVKTPIFDANSRSKTALRIRYEAEVEVIRRKIGSLEEARNRLGLSQRKICQLLMVDPSAWSRWTRHDEKAPPHIYRMLQWYLALEEKYPALDTGFWLQAVRRAIEPVEQKRSLERIAELEMSINQMRSELEHLRAKTKEAASIGAVPQKREDMRLKFGVFFLAGLMIGALMVWAAFSR